MERLYVMDDTSGAKVPLAVRGRTAANEEASVAGSSRQHRDKENIPAIPARSKKEKASIARTHWLSCSMNMAQLFLSIEVHF